jgi:hypothetical protein
VIQALMQGLLLRSAGAPADPRKLTLFDMSTDFYEDLHARWDKVTEREKRSRTLFAQRTIKVDEVAREWRAVREAIGTRVDVRRFVEEVVTAQGGFVAHKPRHIEVHLPNRAALREAAGEGGGKGIFDACFELPAPEGALYLTRTHPTVEGLASYVMDAAQVT